MTERLIIPYSDKKKWNFLSVQHRAREGKACKQHITILWLFCQTLENGSYLFTIFELFLRARVFMFVCVCVCVCVYVCLEGVNHLNSMVFFYFKLLRGIGWFIIDV